MALAFLIADIGLDPLLTVQLIERHWTRQLRRRVHQAIASDAREEGHGWFLVLQLVAMRGPWAKDSAVRSIGAFQRRRSGRSEGIEMWLDHTEEHNFCALALSYVLFRLKDHLEATP